MDVETGCGNKKGKQKMETEIANIKWKKKVDNIGMIAAWHVTGLVVHFKGGIVFNKIVQLRCAIIRL